MPRSKKQIIANRLNAQKIASQVSDHPATASQIRYKVDSAKYLKYAKQTHFAVNGW